MKIRNQRGSALFVALIVITLLLLLGASTLSGSMVELKLSGVTKRNMDGFQKSEAGVNAVMSLVDQPEDPFTGVSNSDPFQSFLADAHPLREVTGGTMDVDTTLIQGISACSRKINASSNSKIACEYYDVQSTHREANTSINTTVIQGVRKEIISN